MKVKGIWLQYYLKEWSFRGNAEFAIRNGMQCRPNNFDWESIGTYMPFAQLDSDLVQVNQMLKYIKFGFGQCIDNTCYDLRDGIINRKEALELVKKYDGKCAEQYIKKFCNYIEISIDEFWRVANSFRRPMWTKKENEKWDNDYWKILENE